MSGRLDGSDGRRVEARRGEPRAGKTRGARTPSVPSAGGISSWSRSALANISTWGRGRGWRHMDVVIAPPAHPIRAPRPTSEGTGATSTRYRSLLLACALEISGRYVGVDVPLSPWTNIVAVRTALRVHGRQAAPPLSSAAVHDHAQSRYNIHSYKYIATIHNAC